jgi:hypothetical protein
MSAHANLLILIINLKSEICWEFEQVRIPQRAGGCLSSTAWQARKGTVPRAEASRVRDTWPRPHYRADTRSLTPAVLFSNPAFQSIIPSVASVTPAPAESADNQITTGKIFRR